MNREDIQREKYRRAKKQVEEIKGFYIHLVVYLLVNAFILVNIYNNVDDFWIWPHFFTLLGWGIGLAFHAAKVFGYNPLFGKEWEKRMIEKYMEEDKREMEKYK
jgi:hypothetical protein